MSSTKQPREKKKASLGFSILTVLVLIAFITLMLTVGKAPIVVVMILAWLVLVPFALYLGYSMHETEKFALDLIKPGHRRHCSADRRRRHGLHLALCRYRPRPDLLGTEDHLPGRFPSRCVHPYIHRCAAHRHVVGHRRHHRRRHDGRWSRPRPSRRRCGPARSSPALTSATASRPYPMHP